jgi:hypothetical protein
MVFVNTMKCRMYLIYFYCMIALLELITSSTCIVILLSYLQCRLHVNNVIVLLNNALCLWQMVITMLL